MSESETTPRKRPAREPAARLAAPPLEPAVPRPASTVAGAVLVLLRVVSGALVLVTLMLNRGTWANNLELLLDGADVVEESASVGLVIYAGVSIVLLLVQLVLGLLILRGQNLARVLVMFFSVLSIITAFVGWWSNGQEINIAAGTLISLALDILILLALSSRSAAAYARRNQRP